MNQQTNFILFTRDEFKLWFEEKNISRKVTTLQVHHTWLPNYSTRKGQDHFRCLEGMRNAHLANGWNDIGQHLTTFEDGLIAVSRGRDLNVAPAGIKGANSGAICIENVGNFDLGGDVLTSEQQKTIVWLYAALADKYKLPVDTEHIVYHHWYDAEGKKVFDFTSGAKIGNRRSSKSCPGSNFFGDGNTVEAANRTFISMIKQAYERIQQERAGESVMKTFSKYYEDVDKEWMAGSIDRMRERGLLNGKTDKLFKPEESLTRGEMAAVLDRLICALLNGKLK